MTLHAMPPVRRRLYVERIEVTAPPAELQKAAQRGVGRDEHLHDKALVEAGKLVLGGPFEEPLDGAVYVLKAADLAEAKALAAVRPIVKAGLARSVVNEWQVLYEAPL